MMGGGPIHQPYTPGVKDTSIEAYHDTTDERMTNAERVLRLIRMGSNRRNLYSHAVYTIAEIAAALDMEKSSVSGRCNELLQDNKIVRLTGKVTCTVTGKRVYGMFAL